MRVSHVEAKLIRFFEINRLYFRNYASIMHSSEARYVRNHNFVLEPCSLQNQFVLA